MTAPTLPYIAEVLAVGVRTIDVTRGVNQDGTPGALTGVSCDFTARLAVGSVVLVQDLGGQQVALARLGSAQGVVTVSTGPPPASAGWFTAALYVRPDPAGLDPELWIDLGTGV